MPPSIRKEVEQFAFNAIVRKIGFFKDKDKQFLLKIISKFRSIQIYANEILYNGQITLYFDISGLVSLPPGTIDYQS